MSGFVLVRVFGLLLDILLDLFVLLQNKLTTKISQFPQTEVYK